MAYFHILRTMFVDTDAIEKELSLMYYFKLWNYYPCIEHVMDLSH